MELTLEEQVNAGWSVYKISQYQGWEVDEAFYRLEQAGLETHGQRNVRLVNEIKKTIGRTPQVVVEVVAAEEMSE
jgi:hypothetical protein